MLLAELEIVVWSDKFVGTALVPTKLVGTALVPTKLVGTAGVPIENQCVKGGGLQLFPQIRRNGLLGVPIENQCV